MLTRFLLAAAMLAASLPLASPIGAAELIVDNRDGQVQVKGSWGTTATTSGHYGADYLFRVPGDGSSTVTWPFPGDQAGKYEVFARWSGGDNRATDAKFQILSTAQPTSITVNQKGNGASWQLLGAFDFVPGKGHAVTLSDKADGVVVADAVRFVGPAPGSAPSAPAAAAPLQSAATPAAQPAPQSPPTTDARYFEQTRYRISEEAFWTYFQRRGGVRSLGYPVSNTFSLFGMQTQIFQRQVLQLRPDGGVQTMNLLDEGLMPYTKMNGSTFPAPDPNVINQSPKPGAANYHAQALQFVRDVAPDTWDGQAVNFSKTFFSTVRLEDAYPNGAPADGATLAPYFNLEIWGLPTSRPTPDPTNGNFIYQRFQRGIMHFDKSCGCTQGLLLADYFKAILTRQNLPADLAEQAKANKLLGANPQGAFRRDPTVTLDAGHGGTEIGTSHSYPDGTVLPEKDLNLRVMLRVRDLLQQAGFRVNVTRTSDSQVNADKNDLTGDGRVSLQDDLQARVDIANAAGADVFVSVHFNGIADPNRKGTFVFWDPDRPFAERSKALAELVDQALVKAMKDAGYTPVDNGATRDTAVLGGGHYYLLSPKTNIVERPSQMPAIIGEGLFLTNEDDANAVRKEAIVEAIAKGYLEGIKNYFLRFPIS
jgi:N-acetylmuramoyl-L-alanine amidase